MDDKKKSKVFVAGLLVVIVLGALAWILLEYTADIIVDRDHGKVFSAAYEKDCQSRYEPKMCRKIAALSHVTCFKSSVKAKEGLGVEYDQEIYLTCLRESEAKSLKQ